MNVVGKVGNLISQGVYSVATPFHPFGGAVDVIVVEQPDGTYRSTPWYVRFGKFQGVLKGAEKFVRISVNGVEAGFHMYLDNSGEAYFVREVVSTKDIDKGAAVERTESLEDTRQDNDGNSKNDNADGRNGDFNIEDDQLSGERISLATAKIENVEADNERQKYEFQDLQSCNVDSVGSSDYRAYHYESLDQLEDVVESQSSGSEVVIISVDGHVLTAPISSAEADMDNVQLSTPQFHLGPGEGADFGGANEEFNTSQDTWASDYLSDIEASLDSLPNNGATEGAITTLNDITASRHQLDVRGVEGELVNEVLEIPNIEIVNGDAGDHQSPEHHVGSMSKKEIFKSCLALQELSAHTPDDDLQDMGSPCMELEVKDDLEDSSKNSPSSLPAMEENETHRDLKVASAELDLPSPEPTSNSDLPALSIKVHSSENNSLTVKNPDVVMVPDSRSSHGSIDHDPEMKDEQFSLAPETSGIQDSPPRPAPELRHSKSEVVESRRGSLYGATRADSDMGFEISLCGNLLYAGLGLGPASEAFNAHRISMEEFQTSASSITKNENLVVRYTGRYLPWEKAAPIILGMAAFGLELPVDPKDAIPIEQDDSLTPREGGTPQLTTTPSGRRWRLWPIPFRRVKTLQHTASSSSSEEVFVDSLSGSQHTQAELTPTAGGGNESPHKNLIRTNVPTTEQIASLNLKDGQNMIKFSFSTRVLGTQEVDAHIYLWKWNARIVISDVDGTITKSDVLGQFMPLVGKDWTQSGVARLFSAIKENGYQLLFLSARAIVQAYLTRSFLLNLKQDGKALPSGPVVISPDGLFPSLYREVIRRAPHEFKIACLEDIKKLFPSDYNPFYAGFGNRDTDELSYRKIGIPKGKIFIINPKGEVAISHRIDVKSYTSLHTLVNDMFPPTSMVEQEDFNSWNYWRMPLPNVD